MQLKVGAKVVRMLFGESHVQTMSTLVQCINHIRVVGKFAGVIWLLAPELVAGREDSPGSPRPGECRVQSGEWRVEREVFMPCPSYHIHASLNRTALLHDIFPNPGDNHNLLK